MWVWKGSICLDMLRCVAQTDVSVNLHLALAATSHHHSYHHNHSNMDNRTTVLLETRIEQIQFLIVRLDLIHQLMKCLFPAAQADQVYDCRRTFLIPPDPCGHVPSAVGPGDRRVRGSLPR